MNNPSDLLNLYFLSTSFSSLRLKEDNVTIFEKLTTRIEHVTGLKANTTQYEAEPMLVSYNKCHSYDEIQITISNHKFSNNSDIH